MMTRKGYEGIKTRKVAILAADGVDGETVANMKKKLMDAGARVKIIGHGLGEIVVMGGQIIAVDHGIVTIPSILFDAVYIPGGAQSVAALKELDEVGILDGMLHVLIRLALSSNRKAS